MKFDLETMKLVELKELAASVEAEILLRVSETPSTNRHSLFQLWHKALQDVMRTRQGITVPPPFVFAKQAHAKIFKSGLASCEGLILKFQDPNKPTLRLQQEMIARKLVLSTLLRWLQDRDVSISISVVCRNMQNAQAAMSAQFPGYLQNDLLPVLLR